MGGHGRHGGPRVPPNVVETVEDLIHWEYAKLIAGSAVGDRKNYGFVMDRFKKLQAGDVTPSEIIRENKLFVESEDECAYCQAPREGLQWEHIIPASRGGPERIDNMVKACPGCNTKKGDKDPFEWYEDKYEIPRLVLGKYLKLVYDRHEQEGTLGARDVDQDGELTVEDLGAVFTK